MNRIKQFYEFFKYSRSQFADLVGVSADTVAIWERSVEEPDYEVLKRLSLMFNISSDFILGIGIFEHWDQILKYYDPIVDQLRNMIPAALQMPSFCKGKYLIAWLDTRLYHEPDEVQLARWFSFSVKEIHVTPVARNEHGDWEADVTIEFTPNFQALVYDAREKEYLEGDV